MPQVDKLKAQYQEQVAAFGVIYWWGPIYLKHYRLLPMLFALQNLIRPYCWRYHRHESWDMEASRRCWPGSLIPVSWVHSAGSTIHATGREKQTNKQTTNTKNISQSYPAVNPVKAKNHICLAQHACGCHSSTDIVGVTTHFLFGFQSHLMDRTCSWHPCQAQKLSVTVLSGDWCLSLSSSKKPL